MEGLPSLDKYSKPKSTARNEREELLGMFLEKLNASRAKTAFKPLTYARLAKLLKGKNLYKLYQECSGANSFGALFWHKLKQKP